MDRSSNGRERVAEREPCELEFDAGTLLLRGLERTDIDRHFDNSLWRFDARVGAFRTDAMHYDSVRQTLDRLTDLPLRYVDRVRQWVSIHFAARATETVETVSLRDDQLAAVESWMTNRRGCVVMPTGTGKTEVALRLIAACEQSALIVAPVRDLMYQWHRRILSRFGIDAGILGDGICRVSPLTVTTYDSAQIHMSRIGNRFGLVVFDECHHLPGPARQDAARMSAAPYRLGLTATPERADGRHRLLDPLIGGIVYSQRLSQARGKTLADYNVQRIAIDLSDDERRRYSDLSRTVRDFVVKRRQEDPGFDWPALCNESGADPEARRALRAFHAKRSIEDRAEDKLRILEDLFRLHAGEPFLVFTGTNAMARDISRKFLIPCLLSHCGKRERLDILRGVEQGDYPGIVANRVLDEGVDLPDVKLAIVIGGSGSSRQAIQRLGRVLRRSRFGAATIYEIVTRQTRDEIRSRRRRDNDAYQRRVDPGV